jgi:hypothetical protein
MSDKEREWLHLPLQIFGGPRTARQVLNWLPLCGKLEVIETRKSMLSVRRF